MKMSFLIQHNNAQSQIIATPELIDDIRLNCLSYMQAGAEFIMRNNPHWDGRTYLCTKKGRFLSGLLPKLTEYLEKQKISFEIQDLRKREPKTHDFKLDYDGKTPRYYQTACVEKTNEHNRGVFVMGTGSGKTLTSAMIVDYKGVPTLIVVPDTGLRDQMTKDYMKWFGAKNVGTKITDPHPIIVINIQALANKPDALFKRFKMLIIDEFHHAAAKSYKDINQLCENAYYRYGFTGTFLRSDGNDLEMHGVLSNVIFKKRTSELIEEGFLVRPYITIVRIDISENNKFGKPRRLRLNYAQAYDYVIKNDVFNKAIADIANQKIKEGKQTLIVVRRVEHGEELHKMIEGSFYLQGKDKGLHREKVKQAFIDKRIRCLVATNIFGEGQDIPSIDVFINARVQKTEIQTAQGIGRALRKHGDKDKAEVFDFLIIGQKHLEDHSVERINSYRKEPAFRIQIKKL